MPGHVHLMFVARPNTYSSMALVKTVQLIKGHKVQDAEAVGQIHAELTSSSYLMAAAGNVQLIREFNLIEEHAVTTSASQARDYWLTALVNAANPSRRRASMAGAASPQNVVLDSYSWLVEHALIVHPT